MVIQTVRRILRERKDREEAVDQITESIGKNLILKMQEELVLQDKVVSGMLADSMEYNNKVVGLTDEGAADVEYGTPPGKTVDVETLKKWAALKYDLSDKEAEETAIAVQKKIFEKGIGPSRFAKISIEKMVGA